jgi:hypothetical protein
MLVSPSRRSCQRLTGSRRHALRITDYESTLRERAAKQGHGPEVRRDATLQTEHNEDLLTFIFPSSPSPFSRSTSSLAIMCLVSVDHTYAAPFCKSVSQAHQSFCYRYSPTGSQQLLLESWLLRLLSHRSLCRHECPARIFAHAPSHDICSDCSVPPYTAALSLVLLPPLS